MAASTGHAATVSASLFSSSAGTLRRESFPVIRACDRASIAILAEAYGDAVLIAERETEAARGKIFPSVCPWTFDDAVLTEFPGAALLRGAIAWKLRSARALPWNCRGPGGILVRSSRPNPPGPPAKGEALCDLSIGWSEGGGADTDVDTPPSAPSLTPPKELMVPRGLCGRPVGCKRKIEKSDNQFDSDHVSGLLTRLEHRWPRWGPRSGPKQATRLRKRSPLRVLWIVGSTENRHLVRSSHTPGIDFRVGRAVTVYRRYALPRVVVAHAAQAIRLLNLDRSRVAVRAPEVPRDRIQRSPARHQRARCPVDSTAALRGQAAIPGLQVRDTGDRIVPALCQTAPVNRPACADHRFAGRRAWHGSEPDVRPRSWRFHQSMDGAWFPLPIVT